MPAASGSASGSPPDNTNGNKRRGKKRIRSFTADERATHSAIEKQRREALNANFIDLARMIPALAPVHRLSKSLIVSESINHLQAQREMCLAAASEIRSILAENIELIAEVNGWREQYGVGLGSRQVKPVNDAVQSLLEIDQQVFGTFPAGFGDNGPGEGHEEQEAENGSTPQMEEHREPTQSNVPPPQTGNGTVPNTGIRLQGNTSIHHLTQTHAMLPDLNDSSEMMSIPNGFGEVGHIPVQSIPLHEDIFSSLDDGYNIPLASNADVPPSTDFAEMNLHQTMYHDFPPEIDYFLRPADDMSNFAYIP
ncbi:uncharacterized protein PAC_06307 [Phialocephala subalpina]|uniref:BHLH domain-containing protein n=1 Tax=Phialocephala subalpina TaxID=576137 RepID=A0A1L7WUI0_9HELO|nr:uncharacterized protein PAC_06307 [Phialocephala subalpina]